MIGRFNDENYDGIVLKIPSFFINANNIGSVINDLKSKLELCNISMFLPDHLNNLYELDNYLDKQKIINNRKEMDLKAKKEYEKNQELFFSGKIIETIWKSESVTCDRDTIYLGDKKYDFHDYFTDKLNIKKSFENDVKNYISNNIDNFKSFINDNFTFLDFLFKNNDGLQYIVNLSSIRFRCSKYNPSLEVVIDMLNAKKITQIAKDNKSYKFRYVKLSKKENGNYFLDNEELHNYILINDKLVCQQSNI